MGRAGCGSAAGEVRGGIAGLGAFIACGACGSRDQSEGAARLAARSAVVSSSSSCTSSCSFVVDSVIGCLLRFLNRSRDTAGFKQFLEQGPVMHERLPEILGR